MNALPTLLLLCLAAVTHAQTATGILDNYIKKSGGNKAWQKVKSIAMNATIVQDDEIIPVAIYSTASGKQALVLKFPAQNITQMAFDGDTYWTTDFTTLEPVKADEEMINNMKQGASDFPSPALNYSKNGYTIAYMGMKTKNGAETYKVKVIQKPLTVNGQDVPNESYYYFDTSTYLPVAVETIEPNGQNNIVSLADYQEVNGLYFPFSIDQDGLAITIKNIDVNADIDPAVFTFPQKRADDQQP